MGGSVPRATTAPSRRHVPALDGVRGLAIVLVLFHNLSVIGDSSTIIGRLWTVFVEAGWIGVQAFFVLSGFLITGILVDDRGEPRALRSFYVRRFLRIFPLYYAFLVVYFVVVPIVVPAARRSASEQLPYWLYLSNWFVLAAGALPAIGHLWSLAVEEQFYLVWPWLAGRPRARTRTIAWCSVALVAGALALRVVLHALGFPGPWLYVSTLTRADALALGALLALAIRDDAWRARVERWTPRAGVVALVAIAAVAAKTHGLNRNNAVVQVYGYSAIGLASAVLVAIAARGEPAGAPRWLSARWLRFFGKYSYGIYVLHAPVKYLASLALGERLEAAVASQPVTTDLAFIAATTAVTVACAVASFRFLEKPFLDMKQRLAPR